MEYFFVFFIAFKSYLIKAYFIYGCCYCRQQTKIVGQNMIHLRCYLTVNPATPTSQNGTLHCCVTVLLNFDIAEQVAKVDVRGVVGSENMT